MQRNRVAVKDWLRGLEFTAESKSRVRGLMDRLTLNSNTHTITTGCTADVKLRFQFASRYRRG
jgi:hypothetical protein